MMEQRRGTAPGRRIAGRAGRARRLAAAFGLVCLLGPGGNSVAATGAADNTTLTGKFIVGYQGWFACPGDPGQNGKWSHWFSIDGKPTIDMLPDVSEVPPQLQCDTGLRSATGAPIKVFSSRDEATVALHFKWMREYGIDGAAIGRFVNAVVDDQRQQRVDRVLASVVHSAEAEGRLFFVMYDLSGLTADKVQAVADDWKRLEGGGITGSRSYAHHRGHPVLGLWGIGVHYDTMKPPDAEKLVALIRQISASAGGVTLLAGVASDWRTGRLNPRRDAAWGPIFRTFDIISPWTAGLYSDDAGAVAYQQQVLAGDLTETRRLGIDYMPVVFPGFSWHNLNAFFHKAQPSNGIPRRCGRFLWHQVTGIVKLGATMAFGAMFDEVDEGTALFKTVPTAAGDPAEPPFVALDADGCQLPSDWYLRLAGAAARALRAEGPAGGDLPFPLPPATH